MFFGFDGNRYLSEGMKSLDTNAVFPIAERPNAVADAIVVFPTPPLPTNANITISMDYNLVFSNVLQENSAD
jgi:hypothetical protein